MDLLEALDLQSPTWHGDLGGAWDTLIEECLWPVLADRAEQQRVVAALTKGRAWILLSWAGDASSLAVRHRSSDLLREALGVFPMVDGPLDRRDVLVVASVVRRACALVGVDFETLVTQGGGDGEPYAGWLAYTSPRLPSFYCEVGSGDSFEFRRERSNFDEAALLERLREKPKE